MYSKMDPKPRRIRNPKSKKDLFASLPQEIITDILSRLRIQSIMRCKCVCKSWLNLLESLDFAKSHLSRSVPGLDLNDGRPLALALYQGKKSSNTYKTLEIVDTRTSMKKYCNTVFDFNLPRKKLLLHSSVNGLLFLMNRYVDKFFICNPVTREYIKLPPPSLPVEDSSYDICMIQNDAFGFGASKLTGKYKVVRMFHEYPFDWLHLGLSVTDICKCEVYTLGTRSWRSVAAGDRLVYKDRSLGFFLNGNLHWLVQNLVRGSFKISYFDLETECFSTFSVPPLGYSSKRSMCILGDSLCFCDNFDDKVVIWLMKEYGDDESWIKEFVIKKRSRFRIGYMLPPLVVPIKMFKDGNILFARELSPKLYCYSSKTKRVREISHTKSFAKLGFQPTIYTPSFLSLKTFAMESVISF